jgi:hypothetical protein
MLSPREGSGVEGPQDAAFKQLLRAEEILDAVLAAFEKVPVASDGICLL